MFLTINIMKINMLLALMASGEKFTNDWMVICSADPAELVLRFVPDFTSYLSF